MGPSLFNVGGAGSALYSLALFYSLRSGCLKHLHECYIVSRHVLYAPLTATQRFPTRMSHYPCHPLAHDVECSGSVSMGCVSKDVYVYMCAVSVQMDTCATISRRGHVEVIIVFESRGVEIQGLRHHSHPAHSPLSGESLPGPAR